MQDSSDPEGLRVFYYLVQDLKALVFSLISLHFKVRLPIAGDWITYVHAYNFLHADQAHLDLSDFSGTALRALLFLPANRTPSNYYWRTWLVGKRCTESRSTLGSALNAICLND